MQKYFNMDRVALAYHDLEPTSTEQVDLTRWMVPPSQPECNTICCGAGWLAQKPTWQDMGLALVLSKTMLSSSYSLVYRRPGQDCDDSQLALQRVFGKKGRHFKDDSAPLALTHPGAHRSAFLTMFCIRGQGVYDSHIRTLLGKDISDKDVLLARIQIVHYMGTHDCDVTPSLETSKQALLTYKMPEV